MISAEEKIEVQFKDRAIEKAIAAHPIPIVPGGSAQLVRLWGDDFIIETDSAGRMNLASKTGKPVSEEIAGRLHGEYRHFAPGTPTLQAEQVEAGAREFILARMAKSGANHGSFGQAQAGDHYGL